MSAAISSSSQRRASSAAQSVHVPGVWLGHQLCDAHASTSIQPTGYAALDAELPGGGWPVGALTELLHAAPTCHTWQLLQPALAQATAARPGTVVLVAPPYEPFAPALRAAGFAPERLFRVHAGNALQGTAGGKAAACSALWAAEQALRCRDVLAVVAWLPQALPEQLRRLHLAAAQMGQLLWVLRPASTRQQASPAPLRLAVRSDAVTPQAMQVQVIKRRGPPLAQAVVLPGCSGRLAQVLTAAAVRAQQRRNGSTGVPLSAAGAMADTVANAVAGAIVRAGQKGVTHALDRLAEPAVW